MTRLRAIAFNSMYYGMMIGYMVFCPFMLFIPREKGIGLIRDLMRRKMALQRLFGMTIEVRGAQHLPVNGGIVAAKHQSIWETFALHSMVPDAVFIYKKELGDMPLFGAYMRKFEQIEIDRKSGPVAAAAMARDARAAIALGRQIMIFPEGTRRPPGAEPKYKYGITRIYTAVEQSVVPVVLNSGFFWSNYFWSGHRGRLIVDVLPAIPAGLSADEFFKRLVETMEEASDRLFIETATSPDAPPLTPFQRQRLAELQAKAAQVSALPAES
ncbi:lysophospholipid acyltransferase family protein [Candidatus Raskinella chloraquaticus]